MLAYMLQSHNLPSSNAVFIIAIYMSSHSRALFQDLTWQVADKFSSLSAEVVVQSRHHTAHKNHLNETFNLVLGTKVLFFLKQVSKARQWCLLSIRFLLAKHERCDLMTRNLQSSPNVVKLQKKNLTI